MVATMASDKNKKKGRPKGSKPAKAFQIRAPLDLYQALERAAERNRRTKNQEMLVALEKYLREQGIITEPQ